VFRGVTVSGRPSALPEVDEIGRPVHQQRAGPGEGHGRTAPSPSSWLGAAGAAGRAAGPPVLRPVGDPVREAGCLPLFDTLVAFESYPIDRAGPRPGQLLGRDSGSPGPPRFSGSHYALTLTASADPHLRPETCKYLDQAARPGHRGRGRHAVRPACWPTSPGDPEAHPVAGRAGSTRSRIGWLGRISGRLSGPGGPGCAFTGPRRTPEGARRWRRCSPRSSRRTGSAPTTTSFFELGGELAARDPPWFSRNPRRAERGTADPHAVRVAHGRRAGRTPRQLKKGGPAAAPSADERRASRTKNARPDPGGGRFSNGAEIQTPCAAAQQLPPRAAGAGGSGSSLRKRKWPPGRTCTRAFGPWSCRDQPARAATGASPVVVAAEDGDRAGQRGGPGLCSHCPTAAKVGPQQRPAAPP